MQNKLKTAIVWLRNDLRFTDHQAFYEACSQYGRVLAYYTFEPNLFSDQQWGFKKISALRVQFILQTLQALKGVLNKNNISLIVEQRVAAEGIPFWVQHYDVAQLYYQKEWTFEEQEVQTQLENRLPEKVRITSYYDQFLYHPDDLPVTLEQLPEVFTVFRKRAEKEMKVRPLIPMPKMLQQASLLEQDFPLPTLSDFGMQPKKLSSQSVFPFSGGTAAAKDRMASYFWKTNKLSFYKKTRNGLLGTDYSSKFSPWLANGALSSRMIYWEVKKYEAQVKKNDSTYWLIFELIWRDYFKYISLKHGNAMFLQGGILNRSYDWNTDPSSVERWVTGRTPEPFVNANMLELQQTGFMSNRGRQNVASYFAKNLKLDWRIGAAYFEEQLIDYDVHSNWCNWMYVAGVGNDPRDRVFNVAFQAERYDPHKTYQQRWLQKKLFE